jgi:hypothetical protein
VVATEAVGGNGPIYRRPRPNGVACDGAPPQTGQQQLRELDRLSYLWKRSAKLAAEVCLEEEVRFYYRRRSLEEVRGQGPNVD